MEKQPTPQELSTVIYQTYRAKSILHNQAALAFNEVLSKTPAYKRKIKQLGTPYIKELIRLEKLEFELVEKAENELEDFKGQHVIDIAFERSEKAINLLARMAFVDIDDLIMVMTALAKDKSSIMGITKKILK